jgi:hypothetical protein
LPVTRPVIILGKLALAFVSTEMPATRPCNAWSMEVACISSSSLALMVATDPVISVLFSVAAGAFMVTSARAFELSDKVTLSLLLLFTFTCCER